MKNFEELTIGEMKALTPEQIEEYAPIVGKKFIEENIEKVALNIGRNIILSQIKKMKEMQEELEGK